MLQNDPELVPSWHRRFIKSLKSMRKMCVFWNQAKMLPMWPSCIQNGFKFTPKSSKMLRKTPKVTPKWPPSVPKVTQSDAQMEPKCPKVHIWSHLGLNFGELGANLGQLRVDLGTTWYQLQTIWPKATPKLTQSVPKKNPKWLQVDTGIPYRTTFWW